MVYLEKQKRSVNLSINFTTWIPIEIPTASPDTSGSGSERKHWRKMIAHVGSSHDLLVQWGQFLDHDITHTPVVKGTSESGIKCCGDDGNIIDQTDRHPECFPILLPVNDRLYGRFRHRCMEFVRSTPAPRTDCNFGPREQVNQVTAWIDGSNVYASDRAEAKKLRLLKGGRLRVTRVQGRPGFPNNLVLRICNYISRIREFRI